MEAPLTIFYKSYLHKLGSGLWHPYCSLIAKFKLLTTPVFCLAVSLILFLILVLVFSLRVTSKPSN